MPKPKPPKLKDSDPGILDAIGDLRREVIALEDMRADQNEATKADLERQIQQRQSAYVYLSEQLAGPDAKDLAGRIWAARDAKEVAEKLKAAHEQLPALK